MIPVTTFRRQEGRAVRARRLGARERAARCWPAAPTWSPFDDEPDEHGAGQRAPAFRPPICARSTGRSIAALRAGARRAADPSGAALVGGAGARRAASKSSATSNCSAASGARARRDAPFVAITGTNGKSTTTALIAHLLQSRRPRRAARRQHRHRDAVARAAARRPHPRDRVLVLSDRSCAVARSTVGILINVSADHLDRHGTHRALCRGEGAAGRGRARRWHGGDRRR